MYFYVVQVTSDILKNKLKKLFKMVKKQKPATKEMLTEFQKLVTEIQQLPQAHSSGININILDDEMSQSALFLAVRNGHIDYVKVLSKALIADPGYSSQINEVLVEACRQGYVGIVKILIAAGADPSYNRYGAPLFVACENDRPRCVEALLIAGADTDYADSWGDTALFTAVKNGNDRCVYALLAGGVDPDYVNTHNDTAYRLAHRLKQTYCINALLEFGCKVREETSIGEWLLHAGEWHTMMGLDSRPQSTKPAYVSNQILLIIAAYLASPTLDEVTVFYNSTIYVRAELLAETINTKFISGEAEQKKAEIIEACKKIDNLRFDRFFQRTQPHVHTQTQNAAIERIKQSAQAVPAFTGEIGLLTHAFPFPADHKEALTKSYETILTPFIIPARVIRERLIKKFTDRFRMDFSDLLAGKQQLHPHEKTFLEKLNLALSRNAIKAALNEYCDLYNQEKHKRAQWLGPDPKDLLVLRRVLWATSENDPVLKNTSAPDSAACAASEYKNDLVREVVWVLKHVDNEDDLLSTSNLLLPAKSLLAPTAPPSEGNDQKSAAAMLAPSYEAIAGGWPITLMMHPAHWIVAMRGPVFKPAPSATARMLDAKQTQSDGNTKTSSKLALT